MNAERFERLADAYGADFRRWPEAERDGARAFVAAEPDLSQRLLFEARMIDAALDASPASRPSAALRDAVLAGAPRPGRRAAARRWMGWLWLPGAGVAAAAACAAGIWTGVLVGRPAATDARADNVLVVASAESGWSDLESSEQP